MNMAMLKAMNFIVGTEEMNKMPKLKFVIGLGVEQFILLMVKDLFKDSQTIRMAKRRSTVNIWEPTHSRDL